MWALIKTGIAIFAALAGASVGYSIYQHHFGSGNNASGQQPGF